MPQDALRVEQNGLLRPVNGRGRDLDPEGVG